MKRNVMTVGGIRGSATVNFMRNFRALCRLRGVLNVDVNAFRAHAEHDVGDLPFVPEAKQLRVMLVQFHVRSLVEVADIIPFP